MQPRGEGSVVSVPGNTNLGFLEGLQGANFVYLLFAIREYPCDMVLKPQDLLVVLKLWVGRGEAWTYQTLAKALGLSPAEAHAAVKRARAAGLLLPGPLSVPLNAMALREFLIHGARYAFPAQVGSLGRGVPTAHAAAPLKDEMAPSDDPPPVWPHPEGTVRGMMVNPLYSSVPGAALEDSAIYELLALLDALRIGRARERQMAARMIEERLK